MTTSYQKLKIPPPVPPKYKQLTYVDKDDRHSQFHDITTISEGVSTAADENHQHVVKIKVNPISKSLSETIDNSSHRHSTVATIGRDYTTDNNLYESYDSNNYKHSSRRQSYHNADDDVIVDDNCCLYVGSLPSGQSSPSDNLDSGTCSDIDAGTPPPTVVVSLGGGGAGSCNNSVGSTSTIVISTSSPSKTVTTNSVLHRRCGSLNSSGIGADEDSDDEDSCDSINSSGEYDHNNLLAPPVISSAILKCSTTASTFKRDSQSPSVTTIVDDNSRTKTADVKCDSAVINVGSNVRNRIVTDGDIFKCNRVSSIVNIINSNTINSKKKKIIINRTDDDSRNNNNNNNNNYNGIFGGTSRKVEPKNIVNTYRENGIIINKEGHADENNQNRVINQVDDEVGNNSIETSDTHYRRNNNIDSRAIERHRSEIKAADKYLIFHINENDFENIPADGENGCRTGKGDKPVDDVDGFAGCKDFDEPRENGHTTTIRSARGTIRGVKNRVRAGIATFLQIPTTKTWQEKEAGKIVVYTTTMGIVRETYQRCLKVRQILRTHMVKFEEKDVFMSREVQTEIRERMNIDDISVPQVFVEGIHVGDAEIIERLNESGELRRMLKPYKSADACSTCNVCGGYRLLPCNVCNGSKKSIHRNNFTTELVALKCMNCDEVGLVKCYAC